MCISPDPETPTILCYTRRDVWSRGYTGSHMKITPLKKIIICCKPNSWALLHHMPILSWKDVRNAQHWHYTLHSKPPDKLICCLYADIHKWETKTVSSRYMQYYSPTIPYRNPSQRWDAWYMVLTLFHVLILLLCLPRQSYSSTVHKIITSHQKTHSFFSSVACFFSHGIKLLWLPDWAETENLH